MTLTKEWVEKELVWFERNASLCGEEDAPGMRERWFMRAELCRHWLATQGQGWQPISTAPKDRGIIVSDGNLRTVVKYQRVVGWRHAGEDHVKQISSVQGAPNMGPLVAWMELPPLPALTIPGGIPMTAPSPSVTAQLADAARELFISPEAIESVAAHLESVAWRPDSNGDTECYDEGQARAADMLRALSLRVSELEGQLRDMSVREPSATISMLRTALSQSNAERDALRAHCEDDAKEITRLRCAVLDYERNPPSTTTDARAAWDLRYSIYFMIGWLENAPAEVVRNWKRVQEAALPSSTAAQRIAYTGTPSPPPTQSAQGALAQPIAEE
jgi:hypothetical protein